MASLKGLPPLPKSLSGLMSFSSAQWKEMERIHTMRTIIQQDLNRSNQQHVDVGSSSSTLAPAEGTSSHNILPQSSRSLRKTSTLDTQLAVLRKEMVGLRQLDMSLLCQLWSLNESLLEYKQMLQDRMSCSHTSSPGWDNGFDPSSGDEMDSNGPYDGHQGFELRRRRRSLRMVQEDLSLSSSTSNSSLEFGDV